MVVAVEVGVEGRDTEGSLAEAGRRGMEVGTGLHVGNASREQTDSDPTAAAGTTCCVSVCCEWERSERAVISEVIFVSARCGTARTWAAASARG